MLLEMWADDRVQAVLENTGRYIKTSAHYPSFASSAGRRRGVGIGVQVRRDGRILLCKNQESAASDVSC